jgi:ABC-type branched-subunit amino acid transport system substrate-binding protein
MRRPIARRRRDRRARTPDHFHALTSHCYPRTIAAVAPRAFDRARTAFRLLPRSQRERGLAVSASFGIALQLCALLSIGGSLGDDAAPGDGQANVIHFGMCTALTGPSADLGREMLNGVQASFAEINGAGGVKQCTLELTALDDGYEPARTAPQMRKLIDEDKVLAVIGNVGTPTAIAALPIAAESGTPFVAPFTGAGVLRKSPPERNVINYRASYAEETAAMVDALIAGGLRGEQIALFTQRDSFGDSGYSGAIEAMKKHGLRDEHAIVHLRYERNSVAVESAVADLLVLQVEPRAVILVGTYAPCASFIRQCREHGSRATFLCVSFVGAMSLARDLGTVAEDVYVTQVVPHLDADLPIVRQYHAALAKFAPQTEPCFTSLEGYIAGRMLVRALEGIPGTPTRAALLKAFENLGTFDIGLGEPLHFDAAEHQASHHVWFSVIRAGRVMPINAGQLVFDDK